MRYIKGKQPVVVGCIACDTHAVSTTAGSNVGTVDTHVDAAVVGINVAVVDCRCLIDIVHVASSRVDALMKGVSLGEWHAYDKEHSGVP